MSINFTKLYEEQVLLRPKLVCVVILIVSMLFISQIKNFRLDASSDTLVLQNDIALQFYREIKQKYGSDDFLIMTFSPDQDLFASNTLQQLSLISQELNQVSEIESITSILTVPLINSPAISVEKLKQEIPTLLSARTEITLARQEILSSPIYRNLLISSDSKTTAFLLYLQDDEKYQTLKLSRDEAKLLVEKEPSSFKLRKKLASKNRKLARYINKNQHRQEDIIESVRQVMAKFSTYGQLHLGGVPMITADSIAFIRHDLINFGFVVLLFIIITLLVAFSRIQWMLLPLITCVITGAVMIGLLGLLNWPVTVVSSNFISLMLILTLSLTIHLIVRYQELHWQNPHATQFTLVSTTLKKKFIPCLFTSITTIVAFVSLLVSGIRPVIDFGWMMTIGVALSFLMVFTLFPAMLMLLPVGKPVNQQNLTKQLALFLAGRLLPDKKNILITYIIIILLSLIGASLLTVENRFIDYFKENTEIYQGMSLIDKKLGGTTPLDVIIDAPKEVFRESDEDKILDAEFLAELDADEAEFLAELYADEAEFLAEFDSDETETIGQYNKNPLQLTTGYWFNPIMLEKVADYHRFLESIPQTGKVLSIASGMALINQIEPATKTDNFILSILYSKLPDSIKSIIINPYISADGNQIRFSIRVFESDKSLKRTELLNNIKQGLVSKFDLAPEQIKFSGMLVLYNNMLQSLFQSQIYTLGTVFFCILLMFILLYRNIKLSIITLIPNLVAASMVLGLMGWLKIPLDIMTITIAAICIGIAVDNSIHYVHRFKLEFKQCQNYKTAMLNSHASIGRAMYYTSITITLGFSILVLSNFMPSMYFGLLTGFSMLVALAANLTLLPLLLVQFKPLTAKEIIK
ncbi:MAG: MMPL family transporter [Saccharospirillaceae bacterium]|nr:MMPL family transporter [Colwellia sp.]NRB77191.1 MMPL family transporter [Saccharospirillaceae bacterium]